jgi:hypothetical protein
VFESCVEIRSHFSDYLDGLCKSEVLRSIRYHLSYCEACHEELDRWQTMQADLQTLPRRRVPPELALRLRVRISQQLHRNVLSRLWVRVENALQPLLLPASGGVLTAVLCFCLIIGSQVAPATKIPDVPSPLVTQPRVRTLPPIDLNTGDKPVVVVTRIDAGGRVMGYWVLSGPSSPELIQRLDRMIYFSVFQPATMFGQPTDGQVVLSLRRITVRG